MKSAYIVFLVLCLLGSVMLATYFLQKSTSYKRRGDDFKYQLIDYKNSSHHDREHTNTVYGFSLTTPAHWGDIEMSEGRASESGGVIQIDFRYYHPSNLLGPTGQLIAFIVVVYPKETYKQIYRKIAENDRFVYELAEEQGLDYAYSAEGMGLLRSQIEADFEFIRNSFKLL